MKTTCGTCGSEVEAPDVLALREKLGMSREALAVAVGKSATTIGRWERAETMPNLRDRKLMRDLLAKK